VPTTMADRIKRLHGENDVIGSSPARHFTTKITVFLPYGRARAPAQCVRAQDRCRPSRIRALHLPDAPQQVVHRQPHELGARHVSVAPQSRWSSAIHTSARLLILGISRRDVIGIISRRAGCVPDHTGSLKTISPVVAEVIPDRFASVHRKPRSGSSLSSPSMSPALPAYAEGTVFSP